MLQRYSIDLIVCGMHFDDSHMIDFLQEVKKESDWADIPFVCWQNNPSKVAQHALDDAGRVAVVLGACIYLGFEEVRSMPDEELRKQILDCLVPKPLAVEH